MFISRNYQIIHRQQNLPGTYHKRITIGRIYNITSNYSRLCLNILIQCEKRQECFYIRMYTRNYLCRYLMIPPNEHDIHNQQRVKYWKTCLAEKQRYLLFRGYCQLHSRFDLIWCLQDWYNETMRMINTSGERKLRDKSKSPNTQIGNFVIIFTMTY